MALFAALLRGSPAVPSLGGAQPRALALSLLRGLASGSQPANQSAAQAQPVERAEDQEAGAPNAQRWARELGVVRTDWTCVIGQAWAPAECLQPGWPPARTPGDGVHAAKCTTA
jgi:hypothetical protein